MTLKPPILALTISAFLALPASAAKPTNDAAAFKTFDLYANRTAVGDSVHDHVNLSEFPAWLNTDALLAYEGTDTVAYFKSRPYDCIGLNAHRTPTPVQSYVEYTLNPPSYLSSLGLLLMTDRALRVSPTQDSTRTICDITLTYADGDTAYRELRVGTNVRNYRCGVNPCFGLLSCFFPYPLMCAPVADSLSREVYADATYKFDALEVPFRKAELKYYKKVSRVRINAQGMYRLCGLCPVSTSNALIGLSTWPNFMVKDGNGDSVIRKSQFTNVDHGGYVFNGSLVGTRRTTNVTACQVASMAMNYTYMGFPCGVNDLNAYLQQQRGYEPDQAAIVTFVSPSGDAIRYTATGESKLNVGDRFLVERGKGFTNPLATYQVTVAGRNGQASRFAIHSPTIPSAGDPGRVYWKMKPRVADGFTGGQLRSRDLYSPGGLAAQVESLLVRDIPVQVNVPGHFVVASGWTSAFRPNNAARGTYWIKDPYDPRNYTKLIEGKYANTFKMARYVVPTGALKGAGVAGNDPPGLGILASGARRIEIIDPLGRRMLRDANTDEIVSDIPDASIEDVSSEHDNGGDVDDPLTGYDVEIPTTVDGHYTVNVFADDGLAMSASGYTSAGIFASDDAVDTTAAPMGATYDVLYSGSGQTVTVTRTGSVGVVPALPSGPGLLRVRKSPTTGPVEFVLTGAQVAGETIEVFDISGRHVDVVHVAGDGGNQIVPWRWQSVGCRPGVYLARLRSRPGETTRFVILR